jgi:pimeloyl-ACP methyl ester carboxylesterase
MSNALIAQRDRFTTAHPEERVAVNGREWGAVRAGSAGPALVLIPGTLGRADIFWQQIEALRDRAHILALTYPASGGIVEWAGDLAALMDRFGIDRATVLGSSLGGYLVQYFAASHRERTDRLIAANTLHSVAEIASHPPYSGDLDGAPIAELRAGFRKGLGAWGEAHPDQRELVELLLAEADGRIPEAELRNRLKALKIGPELPEVALERGRIATIEASDDPLIPEAMRQAVRERLRPAAAYRFDGGGHFPYVSRPALYVSLLEEQLGLDSTGEGWGSGEMRVR